MVRSQTRLLIWLISNYKGQVKLSLQTQTWRGEESCKHSHRDEGTFAARSSCSGKKSVSSVSFFGYGWGCCSSAPAFQIAQQREDHLHHHHHGP